MKLLSLRVRSGLGTTLIFLAVFCAPAMADDKTETHPVFRAGAAVSNITPFLGTPVAGAGSVIPTSNVHDELHARTLVLDDGVTRFALVVCDSSGISHSICAQAREYIAANEAIQILPENVMISATHTHSGPAASLPNYHDFLAQRIADSVQCAISNLGPAKIAWGGVEEPSELFNRRWFVSDKKLLANPFGGIDQVMMNPPVGHKSLLKPAGGTDPEVSFVSVQSPEGRPIALLANYSLHYVGGVASGHISADYFGVFANRMSELLGADREFPQFVGIMSNGTSGDVINIDRSVVVEKRPAYEKIHEVAEKIAQRVAEAHRNLTFHDWVPLGVAQRELPLKARTADPEQIKYAKEVLNHPEDLSAYPRDALKYAAYVERLGKGDYEVPQLVQVFRIGDLAIATIPYETFTETGLDLKKKSPFADSFTIELANGAGGYMPPPAQLKLGGYETWFGTNRVQVDASEVITKAILEMMHELKGQK
ncbi:MAG: neutral/alkaline non-lysosomal ceramidase N-terminal domain-containing protein [Verrucomicrobiales bacterium]|nr:neutral/alkaline non-lysosomal ceramidase N-terminal domain-containing protein [Verrucomicrobiales bacterium]